VGDLWRIKFLSAIRRAPTATYGTASLRAKLARFPVGATVTLC
jgi:hypothetical protein